MAFQRHDLPDTRDDDGGRLLSETLVAPPDELEAAAQSRAVDQHRHQVRSMSPRKLDEITYAFARTFKRSDVQALRRARLVVLTWSSQLRRPRLTADW